MPLWLSMRLFIAIDINDATRKAIAALQQDLKHRLRDKGINWVRPDNMHLTLKFLGETDDNKLDEVYGALETACSGKKPFEIIFSIIGAFGRPSRVLWLGCQNQPQEIVSLASDLENAFEIIGFEKETRPFSSHLTLARIKDNIERDLQKVLKEYPKIDIPKVCADSLCLYKSQLTSDGSIYTLLRKIDLV